MCLELIKASLVNIENVNIPIVFEGKRPEVKFGKLCFFLGVITLITSSMFKLGQIIDFAGIGLVLAGILLFGFKPKIAR